MDEQTYEAVGFQPVRCFPDSFKPVWAFEASGDAAADEQAWQDYNLGLQIGSPPGFAVLLFNDDAAYQAAISKDPALGNLTTVRHPDGALACWFLNQEPDASNSYLKDLAARLIVGRNWVVPAPPSHVGVAPCEFVQQAKPILLPFKPPLSSATPALIKPFAMQAIPLRGYMAFAPPEQPPYMANGLIDHKGKIILAGPPKIGKSRLALNAAFSLVTAQPFLGFDTYRAARVLFLQFEIAEPRFRQRVNGVARALKIPPDNDLALHLITLNSLRLDAGEGVREFKKLVRATRAEIVFLDPMAKLHTGDENEQADMQQLLNTLDDCIEELGISVILVHHISKPGGGEQREAWARLRGSSYIPAWADSMLILERASPDALPQVRSVLRNGEDFVRVIKFTSNHTLKVVGDIDEAMRDWIQELLYSEPGLSRKQLAMRAARAWSQDIGDVLAMMKRMEKAGTVLPS